MPEVTSWENKLIQKPSSSSELMQHLHDTALKSKLKRWPNVGTWSITYPETASGTWWQLKTANQQLLKMATYRKLMSSTPVYYSIFEHFWGATNWDVLLTEGYYIEGLLFNFWTETCYYLQRLTLARDFQVCNKFDAFT